MFVYSLRASTLKFFAVICVALVTLITLITLIPDYGSVSTSAINEQVTMDYNFDKVKTNEDRIAFLSQFGWEVNSQPVEAVEVTIPSSFDKIFTFSLFSFISLTSICFFFDTLSVKLHNHTHPLLFL